MSIKIKNKKDKELQEKISKKMGLFDQTPSHCLACEAPFNKEDKEMVLTWYVVVREAEKEVNLYCPECWMSAKKMIEEMRNDRTNS